MNNILCVFTLYIGCTAGSCLRVATQNTSITRCVLSRWDSTWNTWNSAWRTHILAISQARGASFGRKMGVSKSGVCSSWGLGRETVSVPYLKSPKPSLDIRLQFCCRYWIWFSDQIKNKQKTFRIIYNIPRLTFSILSFGLILYKFLGFRFSTETKKITFINHWFTLCISKYFSLSDFFFFFIWQFNQYFQIFLRPQFLWYSSTCIAIGMSPWSGCWYSRQSGAAMYWSSPLIVLVGIPSTMA